MSVSPSNSGFASVQPKDPIRPCLILVHAHSMTDRYLRGCRHNLVQVHSVTKQCLQRQEHAPVRAVSMYCLNISLVSAKLAPWDSIASSLPYVHGLIFPHKRANPWTFPSAVYTYTLTHTCQFVYIRGIERKFVKVKVQISHIYCTVWLLIAVTFQCLTVNH